MTEENDLLARADAWVRAREEDASFLNGLTLGVSLVGLLCLAFLAMAIG